MKKAYSWKRTVISVILTVVGICLLTPMYCRGNLSLGYLQTRFINKKALIVVNSDKTISYGEMSGVGDDKIECDSDGLSCRLLIQDLLYEWQRKEFVFSVEPDAKVVINFGISESAPHSIVDYNDITINGNNIVKNIVQASRGKPYNKDIKVAGKKLILSFKVRRHHFTTRDLCVLYGFNGDLFISLTILLFLCLRKLMNYADKLKTTDNNSQIDIVFILVFAVILFLPMSRISTADKSLQENRILAKYKPLFTSQGLNLKYGDDFEKWFNDRFWGRNLSFRLYKDIMLYLNNIYKNGDSMLMKENNWMFQTHGVRYAIQDYRKMQQVRQQVSLLNDFCKEHNIKVYMIVIPNKESIYAEKLPITQQELMKLRGFTDYVQKLLNRFEIPTVFPYDELRKASEKDLVFFKQSHHWTEWGAYVGYNALMELIKKDYPDIHVTQPDEYNIYTSKLIREDWDRKFGTGQTSKRLYIDKKYAKQKLLLDNYVYYDHKEEILPVYTDIDLYKVKYFRNNKLKKGPKVFLTGTSMNENLLQFLPYSFSEVIYYRLNDTKNVKNEAAFMLLKRYKKEILAYNPDILILCISYNNIPNLINLTLE